MKPSLSSRIFRLRAHFSPALLGVVLGAASLATTTDGFGAATPELSKTDSALQKLYAQAKVNMPEAATSGMHARIATLTTAGKAQTPGRFDANGRVLLHVHLDGTASLATVSAQIAGLNGRVLGTNEKYRHGVFAAYLPTDQIANASKIAGVRTLTMEFKPQSHVGTYTSQGTTILQTAALNQMGLKGDGITVGVISDSFDTAKLSATPPATTAAEDVATGDLPVVNVLEDFVGGGDEGRAMCQIVYDEAPHCALAFATADVSEVDFANNIVNLRTEAGASVIVDDVSYFDEPVFSDGMVAQSVNLVADSQTLPGKPAVYCSSAGNDGNNGYRGTYRNLTDAQVRKAGGHGNLILNVTDPTSPNYLDPSLTAGGWYNWSTTGGKEPSTPVEAPGPTTYPYAIFLQWDDLFDQDHGITTSFNFLVFDANGNYLPTLSSTSNAFITQEPFQGIGYLDLGTEYQIAITKTTQTDPFAGPIPTHHLALYTTLDGASFLTGKYFYPAPLNVPNTFGHSAADGAISVAAYAFSWRAPLPYAPELENFTSPGPVTIYFDQNDNRLTTPIIRAKPEVAGVDGVITTFFGAPYYNYPFAFFGTSAAAPSVAGVAALMEQSGGGPGSIAPATVKQKLEASTVPRNSTVEMTQAVGTGTPGSVSISALGQSYFGPGYLTVSYPKGGKSTITQLTIDGTASGLVFNTTEFELGTLTGIASGSITVSAPSTSSSTITLTFAAGTFKPGVTFSFTLGQNEAGTYAGYTQSEFGAGVEAEDFAFGTTFTATFASKGATVSAPFKFGAPTSIYLPSDGYGLINAVTAVGASTTTAAQ